VIEAVVRPEVMVPSQVNRLIDRKIAEYSTIRPDNLMPSIFTQFQDIPVKDDFFHAIHRADEVEFPEKRILIPAEGAEMVVIRKMKV
jgi:hypothetical protein